MGFWYVNRYCPRIKTEGHRDDNNYWIALLKAFNEGEAYLGEVLQPNYRHETKDHMFYYQICLDGPGEDRCPKCVQVDCIIKKRFGKEV